MCLLRKSELFRLEILCKWKDPVLRPDFSWIIFLWQTASNISWAVVSCFIAKQNVISVLCRLKFACIVLLCFIHVYIYIHIRLKMRLQFFPSKLKLEEINGNNFKELNYVNSHEMKNHHISGLIEVVLFNTEKKNILLSWILLPFLIFVS